jgi:hypothetical protein
LIGKTKEQVVSVGGHLWLDRSGRPMRSAAIRQQIETRTKQAFGKAIWPHLFRDCQVVEAVGGTKPGAPLARYSLDLSDRLHETW